VFLNFFSSIPTSSLFNIIGFNTPVDTILFPCSRQKSAEAESQIRYAIFRDKFLTSLKPETSYYLSNPRILPLKISCQF
jgi:hypothetical protein